MSRITAPASKLTRTLLESQRSTGAAIMPKYDELLRTRRSTEQHTDVSSLVKLLHLYLTGQLLIPILQSSRGLTTTHRPTPQPSLANRVRPLMQTFSSSASSRAPVAHHDTVVLPKIHPIPDTNEPLPRMPFLPDNYGAFHHSLTDATDITPHGGTIVAANPDAVVPGAPMVPIEGIRIDSVDMKFMHEQQPEETDSNTFLTDMLRSMADDILGNKAQVQKAT